jgi:hypothetical protein
MQRRGCISRLFDAKKRFSREAKLLDRVREPDPNKALTTL